MKRSEGSDRIVFALVIVLGVLIVGIIALEIIEAVMGTDTELGPNTATLMATVSGALVGGIAGYVTQSPSKQPEVPEFSAGPLIVAPGRDTEEEVDEVSFGDGSNDPVADSATESLGHHEDDYDDVTDQFIGGR